MSRLPVSVIVTASGSVNDFRACLESLRPTLGLRDEVVCVLPAHRADLRDLLRGKTWLTVLDDDSGDQTARWSAGVSATRHPIVVLLDGDVVLSAHWLDPVLDALGDPAVVAAGPRCHLSLGPQHATVPKESAANVPAFKAYARNWRQENAGRFTDVDRLGPVCVAIRRDALERAGGPTADLPYDRLRDQGRLVIAHGALVAHVGTEQCTLQPPAIADDAPLVSACMIVKDEEDVLAESLTAMWEFVDEIVVYDTGSTDRTRDIAREHGATVIEGYWNDHFGDARNRSLAHCTGKWILGIDADEVITGDAAAAREWLATARADRSAFVIGVQSITGHGTSVYGRQLSPRFFRRNRVTYSGRIHEQVVNPVSGNPLVGPELPGVDIVHSGYTILRSTVKNKGERNVRLSQLAVEDQKDGAWAVVNLARSQLLAGQVDATIETCKKGLENNPREHHRHLLRPLIEAYLGSGRIAEARSAVAQLREAGGSPAAADDLEARLCILDGDFAGALDLVTAIPATALDDMMIAVDDSRTAEIEILALSGLERHHEAADRIRDCVRKGRLPVAIPKMAEILTADGSGIEELATLLPRHALRSLLLAASDVPTDLADRVYETLWQEHRAPMILASAARLGERLPVMRAMEWSARLRQYGFAAHCTLLALAASPARAPRDRVLAAAIAVELFSEERAMPLLEEALDAVPDAENGPVLDDLRRLAPTIAAAIEPASVA
ncbi:glycosyltransferase [Planosporangium thailandense]|uniref:Glycosyltransferase n=1 Tax=Planosporangium thailandense TaxID=765197 RepID=A0ABX0Y2J9_9ACTN|nr:glycosyltransferase [Planosporangium thailandense]